MAKLRVFEDYGRYDVELTVPFERSDRATGELVRKGVAARKRPHFPPGQRARLRLDDPARII